MSSESEAQHFEILREKNRQRRQKHAILVEDSVHVLIDHMEPRMRSVPEILQRVETCYKILALIDQTGQPS